MSADAASTDTRIDRDRSAWVGVYVRGIAMGIAEVVPGVSGGTIAFVSGIYDELIRSLASFRPSSLHLLGKGPAVFWHTHNLSFLLVLGLGMLSGVVLFAHALSIALSVARPVVWGFFLGVICLSVVVLARERPLPNLLRYFPPGLILGLLLINLDPGAGSSSLWAYFFGAAFAVAAWMLPAVSGSFLLLVLGLYEGVLAALVNLDLPLLGCFAAGAVLGLICFANLLSFLMDRHRETLLSLLTGFMAGSLVRLWPWAAPDGSLLLPAAFEAQLAADPLLIWVGVAFCAGMFSIWLLGRLK